MWTEGSCWGTGEGTGFLCPWTWHGCLTACLWYHGHGMCDEVQIFREGKFGSGVSPVAQVALLLRHTGGDRDTHEAPSVTSAVQNHGI